VAAMQSSDPPVSQDLSDADKQKLKDDLQWMLQENRLQSIKLQKQLKKLAHKKSQQPGASKLLACVEKVQADLLAQQYGSAWQPLSPRQQKWLELAKSHQSLSRQGQHLALEEAMLQLRLKLLQQEALVLEEMMGGVDLALV